MEKGETLKDEHENFTKSSVTECLCRWPGDQRKVICFQYSFWPKRGKEIERRQGKIKYKEHRSKISKTSNK